MTTEKRTGTTCESCGVRYYTDTMFHLDTAPECGECQNIRLAVYIACKWTSEAEPSEEWECEHDDLDDCEQGMYCRDCDELVVTLDDMREDFENDRADAIRKGEW
jgi:hypothetical protein